LSKVVIVFNIPQNVA